jgi:hypothetical protein
MIPAGVSNRRVFPGMGQGYPLILVSWQCEVIFAVQSEVCQAGLQATWLQG